MKKYKILSLFVAIVMATAPLSVINANANGIEYKRLPVVSVDTETSYSEILDDGRIRNISVRSADLGNNMYITYYDDSYAEDYEYHRNYFSIIFQLKDGQSIDDFDFSYGDIDSFIYKEVGDNVYHMFSNEIEHTGSFNYETVCELEKALAENQAVEDTDIVWGYQHKSTESSMPETYISTETDVTLSESDFDFLKEYDISVVNLSDDNSFSKVEILYEGNRINGWKPKVEAMRLILTNIDGVKNVSSRFDHEAYVGIDGYSMLEGYSIKGIYDYESPVVHLDIEGDVNQDGTIDISDVVTLALYISDPELYFLNEQSRLNADVHCKGNGLNASDILTIQQYLAGNIDNF